MISSVSIVRTSLSLCNWLSFYLVDSAIFCNLAQACCSPFNEFCSASTISFQDAHHLFCSSYQQSAGRPTAPYLCAEYVGQNQMLTLLSGCQGSHTCQQVYVLSFVSLCVILYISCSKMRSVFYQRINSHLLASCDIIVQN